MEPLCFAQGHFSTEGFLLHFTFPNFKKFSAKVWGQQTCSILPFLCEKTVEVSIKSLRCWITDELILQASGFINALSADCHISSTGGWPQPSRVVHKMIPLERSLASLEPSDPVSACLRQHRQASFSEVNCPSSMSGNGAGSAQRDIFSCTLKWARTIIHASVRHMLALVQAENAAVTLRRPDVWKGQMWSHDCDLQWEDLGSSLSHEGVICKIIPSGQKLRLQHCFSYAHSWKRSQTLWWGFLFVCFVFWPENGVFNSRTMFPCHCFAYITLKMTNLLDCGLWWKRKTLQQTYVCKNTWANMQRSWKCDKIIHVALNIIMYSVFFDVSHIFFDFTFVQNFVNLAKGSKRVKRYF